MEKKPRFCINGKQPWISVVFCMFTGTWPSRYNFLSLPVSSAICTRMSVMAWETSGKAFDQPRGIRYFRTSRLDCKQKKGSNETSRGIQFGYDGLLEWHQWIFTNYWHYLITNLDWYAIDTSFHQPLGVPCRFLGGSMNGVTPIAGWFLVMENPSRKWMMNGGTPMDLETSI